MHRDGHFDYSLLPSRTISLPLTTPTSCSPSPSHYLRYTRSFIPTWFHHPALSPPFFLPFFILPFSPSLPPFLYTQRVVTLGLDRTDLLFTCARNNYIQPRFFCHEPRSYELARGGNELSYCKIVPGCNCKRVLRPATRGRLFKRSVLWSALNRRISLYYRQRYERISFGKVLWRMENFHGNNEPIENNSLILGWKTFRVSATRVCYCIVFIFEW